MTTLFMHIIAPWRGFRRMASLRARGERGASMVEYAILLGLISMAAFFAVSAFGTSLSGIFSNATSCVPTNTNTQTNENTLSQANSLSSYGGTGNTVTLSSYNGSGNGNNQLSTGLGINGSPSNKAPSSPNCASTSNGGNQQNVLQLLK